MTNQRTTRVRTRVDQTRSAAARERTLTRRDARRVKYAGVVR